MRAALRLTWRVSDRIWADDAQFDALLALLLRHPDVADEVALFIAEPSNYVFDPLPRVEKELAIFRRRAEALRSHGVTVGINFWPTFGSGSAYEKSPLRPRMPFPPVVGMDGSVEDSICCPVSPEFLAYTRQKYTMAASAGPTFIWVDDDTRFTHLGGVPYPCFCECCVAAFADARLPGGSFPAREALVAALNAPENRELRHRWSSYAADRLARYCAEVRAAVDSVDPSIDTPFMTVGPTHTTYAGDFIEKCMAALRSRRGRPGHGFYWDDRPEGMLHKAMEVGRQTVRYPADITDVLYEEESYPCAYLDKAIQTRINEVWLALAAGCNGVALNHLPFMGSLAETEFGKRGALALYEREVDALHAARGAWSRFVEASSGLRWQGFWPAFDPFLMAGMDCANGWFKENDPAYAVDAPEQVAQMGLPLTADAEAACGTLLSGKILDALSDETVRLTFTRGVIMDVEALKRLEARGLGRWAGVRPGESRMFARERTVGHPFCGPFAGRERFGIFDPAYDLHPLGEGVETLAVAVDAYDVVYGSCVTAFRNELGGRVVVCGYSPWRFLGHPQTLHELASIADWMGAPLSIRWPDPMRISRLAPFIRGDGARAVVLLINASLDVSEPCELRLRGPMTRAVALSAEASAVPAAPLPATRSGECLHVRIPAIQPWRPFALLAE